MDFLEFVERLHAAGWRATCDGQHDGIKEMWEGLTTKKATGAKLACSDRLVAKLIKECLYIAEGN